MRSTNDRASYPQQKGTFSYADTKNSELLQVLAGCNQQDATFQNFFISARRSTCFRRFFRPSSGAQTCTYSFRYLSDRYCYLLLARKLRFPDYVTMAQNGGKVVILTHRPFLPPGNAPGTHFCYRLSRPQGHSAIGRIMSVKNSNDTSCDRTSDLSICSAAP